LAKPGASARLDAFVQRLIGNRRDEGGWIMHRIPTTVLRGGVLLWIATGWGVPARAEDGGRAGDAETAADVVLVDGTIYTLQDDGPSAVEAIAIRDGAVVAAGSRAEIEAWIRPQTERIDLDGAFAVPGLVDAHAHLFNLGRLRMQADLVGTRSAEECIDIARSAAAALPEGAWLQGRGWDQNDWPVQAYPTKEMLDAAFGDRPVVLRRVDGHASWVNSAALRIVGYTSGEDAPPGGEILVDPDTGEPTGILVDAADDSLRARMPSESAEELDRILEVAQDAAARAGLTGIHDMGLTMATYAAIRRAQARDALRLRIVGYLSGRQTLEAFGDGARQPDPSALVRVAGVKLYADGALGSRGAALLQDYSDRPGHRGLLVSTPEDLTADVEQAFERGFTVAIHAIGDRGNRVALDAIEQGYARALARRPGLPPLRELRARIEHAQVLDPSDIPRFAALGVIPSMQPTHCTSDMPWAPQRLGPDRLAGAYAWRTLLDQGNLLPLGSDFPVESESPLLGLYAARTRQTPAGTPAGGWAPEQRLTALESLLGFTAWAAKACGVETWGRLTPGSRADVTVLDVDPLGQDPRALLDAKVRLTMVEGSVRYRSKAAGGS
jgi:predicted amidohydrolase YtcJ